MEFFKANLLPDDEVISNKEPILQAYFFPLLFKYFIIFTVGSNQIPLKKSDRS